MVGPRQTMRGNVAGNGHQIEHYFVLSELSIALGREKGVQLVKEFFF